MFCTLTKEQASLYAAVVDDTTVQNLAIAEGIQRKGIVLATLVEIETGLQPSGPFLGDNSAVAGRSGKLARLTEMLDEAVRPATAPWSSPQFSEMGTLLQDITSRRRSAARCCSSTARRPKRSATGWSSGSRPEATPRPCSSCRSRREARA